MKTSKLLIILVILLILTVTLDKAFKKDTKKITPTSSPTLTPTLIPTKILPTNTPIPTTPNQTDNSSLIYPNSIIISSSNNQTILQSQDDPQTITDWYKDKIKSLNLNANSFVQTSANGNVLNKLVGANGKKEVRIEISKKADSSSVEIKVSQSN